MICTASVGVQAGLMAAHAHAGGPHCQGYGSQQVGRRQGSALCSLGPNQSKQEGKVCASSDAAHLRPAVPLCTNAHAMVPPEIHNLPKLQIAS